MMREMPHEACGVFGITGNPEASVLTYLGLYALQHRGQETAGIAAWNAGRMRTFTGEGLVADVFDRGALEQLPGEHAIGHVRYSTTGASQLSNAQPIVANYRGGWLALAHNGNLTNADELKLELEERGAIFQTTTDTELLIHLVAQSATHDFYEALKISLMRLRGAYSFVIQKDDQLIAVRDPRGFRPLCLGRLGEAWCVASETCAFDMINAKYVRDVEPGEILILSKEGAKSLKPFPAMERTSCIFELIYYSRPDSQQEGRGIYTIREELGRQLAREHPAQADVVIAVPDSSNVAALGYAKESGIALGQGLIRSHYVGRTFIEP
ncbi:MAG: amidophosphoribosyltransferase, partial [bacterium]